MSAGREIRKLARTARRAGIAVEPTKGGHLQFITADGHVEIIGGSPRHASVTAVLRLIRGRRRHRRT